MYSVPRGLLKEESEIEVDALAEGRLRALSGVLGSSAVTYFVHPGLNLIRALKFPILNPLVT